MTGPKDFMDFERQLHEQMMSLEREFLRRKLEQLDVDAPNISVDGRRMRKALRGEVTVTTVAGAVVVTHHLYRECGTSNQTMSPLLTRAGVFEGFTPHAAGLATFLVTELVPEKAAETLGRFGGMKPSKSTLDRLPKAVSAEWESNRDEFEAALRDAMVVPAAAKTLAVSLDGLLVPFADGEGASKRDAALAEGRVPRGPAGYREVGIGALSLCDHEGTMLAAVRRGQVPETKKQRLKADLRAEMEAVLAKRPDLRIVALADGAADNWDFPLCQHG